MNETYTWVTAVHIFGFLMWAGTLMSCLFLLRAHQSVQEAGRGALGAVERKVAIMMDASALVAIAAGLYLALSVTPSHFKQGGWLHVKTLLVLGLVGIHVFTRIKVRKFRNGEISPLPGLVIPLTLILIAVIVVFGEVKSLMR
jgi:protoporphyrinogen IX oxidase